MKYIQDNVINRYTKAFLKTFGILAREQRPLFFMDEFTRKDICC